MGRFLEAYRRHFGGTKSRLQLYTGFALFFVGAAMALFGIFLVISGDVLYEDLAERRERGIFLAALGLPLIFSGIQLTLPSRRLVHGLVGVGALVCVYAVVQFVDAYPQAWNQVDRPDRSTAVIGWYTLGLIVLFTTTAMALVVNFVSRFVVLPGMEPDDIFNDPNRELTVEEILADIERESAKQNLTWGGMGAERVKSQVIKLQTEFGSDYVISGGEGTKTTELADDHDEDAYRTLMQMRGRDMKETSEKDDILSAVQALIQMRREQKAAQERSWWYRFKRWIVMLLTGGRRRGPEPPKGGAPRPKKTVVPATTPVRSTTRGD